MPLRSPEGFSPTATGEAAINYLARGGKYKECSSAPESTQHLRITGLNPACVIGRDIVISRDHLSNLPQPTTSTSTCFDAQLPSGQPAFGASESIGTPQCPW